MNRPLVAMLRALDDEIAALKMLRYRQQVCALLLVANDSRHLALAADEFENAEEAVSERDLARALASEELGDYWDVESTPVKLRDLIDRATDQEAHQLLDRQDALRVAVQEVEMLRQVTKDLAALSLEAVESRTIDLTEQVSEAPVTYDGAIAAPRMSVQRLG